MSFARHIHSCTVCLAAAAMLLMATVAHAGVLGTRTRVLLDRYNRASVEERATLPGMRQMASPHGTLVNAFVRLHDVESVRSFINKTPAINVLFDTDTLLAVSVPIEMLPRLAQCDGVDIVDMARPLKPCTDQARILTNVDPLHAGENVARHYHGNGVLVGVVDAGFDFTHLSLLTPDYEPRVKYVYMGEERRSYTEPQEIMQLGADTDDTNHGQHVVGIAAGTRVMDYGGMADEADVAIGAMGNSIDEATLLDCVQHIADYAEAHNQPCVINISYGDNSGPHDGSSTLASTLNSVAGEGCIVVLSAGNEGTRHFTLQHTFSSQQPQVATLLSNGNRYSQDMTVETWARDKKHVNVQYFIYDTQQKAEVYTSFVVTYRGAAGTTTHTISTTDNERLAAYGTGSITTAMGIGSNGHFNIATTVKFAFNNVNLKMGMRFMGNSGQHIDMWCTDEYSSLISAGNPDFKSGSPDMSISDMCIGRDLIDVGAYVSRPTYVNAAGKTMGSSQLEVGEMTSFSSYGPDACIKPTMHPLITAPGQYLASSINNRFYHGTPSNAIVLRYDPGDGQSYHWAMKAGTSMAAPVVAGIIALWLEQEPTLTPAQIREVIQLTAINDEFTAVQPERWGAGKIDALAGMNEIAPYTPLPTAVTTVKNLGKSMVVFYNLQGQGRPTLWPGMNIVVTRHEDGHVTTMKVVNR